MATLENATRVLGPRPNGQGSEHMIRRCEESDFERIWQIINDGAQAYKGVIPQDRWREPYMSRDELRHEICEGVGFWGFEQDGELDGVMGIQSVNDVTLTHLRKLASSPVLIGTWADASWAIRFYEKHGFQLVGPEEKNRLLKTYWTVPESQIARSVVLVDRKTHLTEKAFR
jgi:hypothetical protein